MQEKYKAMFEKLQQELRKKQLYVEELKGKVSFQFLKKYIKIFFIHSLLFSKILDDVEIEKLKDALSQQIEIPYKEIVKQLEQELQNLKQEIHKLRHENSLINATKEHDRNEQETLFEQLKLKYVVEVCKLVIFSKTSFQINFFIAKFKVNAIRKDRDIIRQKLQETNQNEANKIKEVLKENNHFKIKVKSLLEENDELREKLEQKESHQNALMRSNSKALSEYSAKIAALEVIIKK